MCRQSAPGAYLRPFRLVNKARHAIRIKPVYFGHADRANHHSGGKIILARDGDDLPQTGALMRIEQSGAGGLIPFVGGVLCGRGISPAMPMKALPARARTDHMPKPFSPQNRISSASSSADSRRERTPPSICAKARGSAFRALISRRSAGATGVRINRAVARRHGEIIGGQVQRVRGRYLMRCGSVASIPKRRRLSSS